MLCDLMIDMRANRPVAELVQNAIKSRCLGGPMTNLRRPRIEIRFEVLRSGLPGLDLGCPHESSQASLADFEWLSRSCWKSSDITISYGSIVTGVSVS